MAFFAATVAMVLALVVLLRYTHEVRRALASVEDAYDAGNVRRDGRRLLGFSDGEDPLPGLAGT